MIVNNLPVTGYVPVVPRTKGRFVSKDLFLKKKRKVCFLIVKESAADPR